MSKRIRLGLIALVLILILSLSLVACVKDNGGDDDGGDEEILTSIDVMDMVLKGHGMDDSAVMNVNLGVNVKVGEEMHRMTFGANINGRETELAIALKNPADQVVFGLYITKGKIYFDSGEGQPKLYLADFDVRDIVEAALKVNVSEELEKLLKDSVDMTLDDIYSLAIPLIFSNPHYEVVDGKDVYTMNVKVAELFTLVKELLTTTVDINQILFNLGLNIDMDLTSLITDLLVPNFMIKYVATMNGEITEKSEFFVSNYDGALYDIVINSSISETAGDIGIPKNIVDYVEFSLTNLSFDAVINVKSDKLDVADLINLVTASNTLPKGLLVLDANRDFAIKVRMDLDVNDNNANKILLEIYDGKTFDKLLCGAYFVNGTLLIKFQDMLPQTVKIPNLKIQGLNISAELQKIVELINGAIATNVEGTDNVVSVNAKETNSVLSPDLVAFAGSVISILGVNDYVSVTDNRVSLKINSEFLKRLNSLIPSLNIGNIGDFGDINIGLNLDKELGIKDIDINADIPQFNTQIVANINTIKFGYINKNIDQMIADAIDGVAFTANLEELLYNTLSGVNIEGKLNIDLPAGTYNIASVLRGFGLILPDLKYDLIDNVNFVSDVKFSMNLNKAEPKKSKMSFEIISNTDTVLAPKGLFIGLYYLDGAMYVDLTNIKLSNVKMPLLKINVDFASMLINEINKLNLADLLNIAKEETSSITPTNDVSNPYISAINDIIEINVDQNKLAVAATSKALVNLFNNFGANIMLPDFNLSGDFYDINDIRMNLDGGELQMNLNINKVVAGVEQDINIDINVDSSYENLMDMLINRFGSVEVSTVIELKTANGEMDLTNIINGILSATGNTLAMPVKMDLVNYLTYLHVNLKWNLDMKDPSKTELMLELRANDASGQLILGLYLFNGTTYLDVYALSAKFRVDNLNLQQRLVDELNTLKDENNWNLTNIINGLLNGGGTVAPPTAPDENPGVPEIPEVTVPEDFLMELLKGITIQNTTVGIKLTSEILNKVLLGLGVDLGVDLSVAGSYDTVEGKLELEAELGKIKAKITAQVEDIGAYKPLPLTTEQFKDFKILDATTGYSMAGTLLDQMSPKFYVDLYTANVDTVNTQSRNHTRLWVEKIEKKGVVGSHNFEVEVGDLVIIVTDGQDHEMDLLHIHLQVSRNMLRVVGTKHLFNQDIIFAGNYNGSMLDIKVPMDIKTMIGDMFDDLLNMIKPVSKAVDNQANGAIATVADTNAGLPTVDIGSLIKDIRVSILPTDQIKAQINFIANPFNVFLNEFLSSFFKSIDLSGMDGMESMNFKNLNYDNKNKNVFFNSLWDNVIKPYINATAPISIPDGIIPGIKNGINDFVKRFLPLPDITEGAITLNLNQGKLSSLDMNFFNSSNNQYFNLNMINMDAEGGIDWAIDADKKLPSIPDIILDEYKNSMWLVYNKPQATNFVYDSLSGVSLRNSFNNKARKIVNGRYIYANIAWTFDKPINLDAPAEGAYVATGTAFGKSITVNFSVMPGGAIKSVKGITASPYGNLPSEVTVEMEDGSTRVLYNVTITAPPTTFAGHTVQGKVSINGLEYNIEVDYLDTTISNLYYGDKFYVSAYDALRGNLGLPSWINIKFVYGGHGSVPVTFDTSKVLNLSINGGTYAMTMTIGSGVTLQTREVELVVKPRIVENVMFDNAKVFDEVYINPYDYMLLAADKKVDAFPKTANINFKNGESEVLAIEWGDISLVQFGFMGGRYKATMLCVVAGYSWTREIDVNVVRRKAFYLTFGEEDNKTETIQIDPLTYNELGAANYFKETANVVFENGNDMQLPVRWDLSGLTVSPDGGYHTVLAIIGSGEQEQTVRVPVRVKPSVPKEVILENGKYSISAFEAIFNKTNPYSSTLTIALEGGSKEERTVTWVDTSNIVIDVNGGTYYAYVVISGVTFKIPVEVEGIESIDMSVNERTIDPYNYNESSIFPVENYFIVNGESRKTNVRWDLTRLDVAKEGNEVTVSAIIGSDADEMSIEIDVVVLSKIIKTVIEDSNNLSIVYQDSLPTETMVVFEDNSRMKLPVTWDLNGNDITKVGRYTVKAIISADNEKLKQVIDVNLAVYPKIIASINGAINSFELYSDDTLPAEDREVTYDDNSKETLPFVWDLKGQDLTVAGEYKVNAIFFGDDEEFKQTIEVTVTVKHKIASVNAGTNAITIAMGTELPESVDVTYENGNTEKLSLSWNMMGNDEKVAGVYNVKAKFFADNVKYNQEFDIVLTVKPRIITSINDGSNDVKIVIGSTLPTSLEVTTAEGKETVAVTWNITELPATLGGHDVTATFYGNYESIKQELAVRIIVVAKEIKSIANVEITTGNPLPGSVEVTYADNNKETINVVWDTEADITTVGTRTISGTFFNDYADSKTVKDVNLLVKDKTIIAVNGDTNALEITVNDTLPNKLTVKYSDSTSKELDVTWGNVDLTTPGIKNVTAIFYKDIEGAKQEITVALTIKDYTIESAANVKITTGATLPTELEVTYADGKGTKTIAVTWSGSDDITNLGTREITATFYDGIANVTQTAKVSLTVVAKEIKSIANVEITTGGALPGSVEVTYADDNKETINVVWDTEADITTVGTRTISGTFFNDYADSKIVKDVNLLVKDKTIIAVNGDTNALEITVNDTLPNKLTVKYSDSTSKELDVTWGNVDLTTPGIKNVTAIFYGNIEGAKQEITVALTIKDYTIESAANVKITTGATLPTELEVTYADGKGTKTIAVTWSGSDDITNLGTREITATFYDGIANVTQTAQVSLTVVAKEIKSIADVEITTGEALPSQVEVTYADDNKETINVVWDTEADITTVGTRTISGTFFNDYADSKTVKVVNLLVKDKTIATVNGDTNALEITVNDTLPNKLTVKYSDSTSKELDVTWGNVDLTTPGIKNVTAIFYKDIEGAKQEITVALTIKDYTIESAANVKITTGGTLPTELEVTYADGKGTKTIAVTWSGSDDITNLGTREITATFYDGIANVTQTAKVSLTVVAKEIKSIADVEITTGEAMPSQVEVTYADDNKETINVVWDTEADITTVGTRTISGTFFNDYADSKIVKDVNLLVKDKTIIAVNGDTNALEITVNDTLPNKLTVKYSDNTTSDAKLAVVWKNADNGEVVTSTVGVFTVFAVFYNGQVNIEQLIEVRLTINAVEIVKIKGATEGQDNVVTMLTTDTTPTSVTVVDANGVEKELNVVFSEFDSTVVGEYTVTATFYSATGVEQILENVKIIVTAPVEPEQPVEPTEA